MGDIKVEVSLLSSQSADSTARPTVTHFTKCRRKLDNTTHVLHVQARMCVRVKSFSRDNKIRVNLENLTIPTAEQGQ